MPIPFRRAAGIILSARCIVLALAMLLVGGSHARATDVVVLTAGAFKPVLLDVASAFQARTGNTLAISNDTAGGVTARIARGEEIDLVIAPTATMDTLVAQGKLVAGTATPVGRSGIGVVVKQGTTPPDISTVEAFKRAMLATPSLAYIDPGTGGSSGIYLAKLFQQMGVGASAQRRVVLVPGGLVASRVNNGEAAIGLQQISELRAVRDVLFVGPLPAEIQHYTVYAGGIPSAARRPAAGQALLAYLRSDATVQALTARGLERP